MTYEVLTVIVPDKMGKHILKQAKEAGMPGGTVFYGQGVSQNKLLKVFGLEETRKECLLFVSDEETVAQTRNRLTDLFKMDQPGHGILFSFSLNQILGFHQEKEWTPEKEKADRKERKTMHEAIFVIVERGESERVLEAAHEAGATGGTVIHARGSGAEQKKRLFNMDIDPEKDVVLILAHQDQGDEITDRIHRELDLDQPNHGVLFRLGVNETRGLAT